MKKFKRSMSIMLVLSIILGSTFIPAAGIATDDASVIKNIEYQSVYDFPEISKEEYIRRLADEENISIEEAYIKDKKHSEEYLNNLAERIQNSNISKDYTEFKSFQRNSLNQNMSKTDIVKQLASGGYFSYYDLKGTQSYSKNSNYSASVNATLKLFTSGSFGEINQVLGDVWSRRESGSYNYDWIGTNHWYEPNKLPANRIVIGCSGYFEVQTDVGIGGGLSLPGFNFDASVGGTEIYKSDTMRITKSFGTNN